VSRDIRAEALARLDASRARLAAALLPAEDSAAARGPGPGRHRRHAALWRWLRQRGRAHGLAPAIAAAEHAFQGWWVRHPWRASAEVFGHAFSQELLPMARRHPYLLVGVGASAGAAVVALQPWRWPTLRRRVRTGMQLAIGWAAAQFSKPLVQALLATLNAHAAREEAAAPAPGPTAPAAAPEDERSKR
jgi:hypothetical protein